MSSDPTLSSLCARLPGDSAIVAALADGGSSTEKAHELMRKSRFVNGAVWSPVDPEPQPAPKLLAANAALAKEIGPPWSEMSDDALIQVVSGNTVLPGTRPWSLRYGGHQFGSWAGQLGDGRAISLGEWKGTKGERYEVQIKGCGRTPFSRFGDGYAVVRSSIREFLASEALAILGVPTSRGLAIVGTGREVEREENERGSVVARMAPSWVRFGNFEMHASVKEVETLQALADYTIQEHFPHISPGHYRDWYLEIIRLTAQTVAGWQSIGFCHGVLNTDNMSILGLTIDYGPYAFLDTFDPAFICNHSDAEGRYSFEKQPDVVLWNLSRLGQVLSPLLSKEAGLAWPEGTKNGIFDPPEAWREAIKRGGEVAVEALTGYDKIFNTAFTGRMCEKLGLVTSSEADLEGLITPLLAILQASKVDYTHFWRGLSSTPLSSLPDYLSGLSEEDSAIELWREWCEAYTLRIQNDAPPGDEEARWRRMREVNPKYVLRNWIAQEIIKATEGGDGGVLLRQALALFGSRDVFSDEDFGLERWAGKVPAWGQGIQCSCSS